MLETHLASALLVVLLGLVTAIDLRTLRIPDPLNAVLVITGLGATWALGGSLLAALIGVCVGYAAIFIINEAFRRVRGRDGVGLGDAKLLAGAGAWLGWTGLPFVVLIGSAMGLAFVAAARIAGRKIDAQHALPFGPFLCAGILIVWLTQTYL